MKTKIQALLTTVLLGSLSMMVMKSEVRTDKARTAPLVKKLIAVPHAVMQRTNMPLHLFSYTSNQTAISTP